MVEIVIAAVIALLAGVFAGKLLFAKNTQQKIDEAESQAKKIVSDAQTTAENLKKEKQLEAKERFVQLKAEHDKEVLEKNRRINDSEARIKQKEQSINQKLENLDKQSKDNDAIKDNLNRQIEVVNLKDKELWAIDSRIAPVEGEYTMLKKQASAFHGTGLGSLLRAAGVDTILVTGVTATACVRTTICDGLADGFRTIAVRECIGDRVPGAVAWNLHDIDAKFADVHSVDDCVNYLNTVADTRMAAE